MQGIPHLAKGEQNVGVLWHIQNNGGRGAFEEDLQGFRVAGAVRDMFIRDVEMGCILEHQIFRFAKIILHHWCGTSYDPASHFFVAGAVL